MRVLGVAALASLLLAAPAHAQRYGFVEFPQDEHQHVTGWDWWWGAAHVVTRSGHRYTLGYDFDSYGGTTGASEELFPLDGPYRGLTVTSMFGGQQMYVCGTVRPDDHVVVSAKPGASVGAGNPVRTCI